MFKSSQVSSSFQLSVVKPNSILTIRAVFIWVSWNQNQSNYNDQLQQMQTLVLVLHLIGWVGGASFLNQS